MEKDNTAQKRSCMDTMAEYYENLYKLKPTRSHPIHEHVKSQTLQYIIDKNADDEWYNSTPTEKQILDIIENKKAEQPPQISKMKC